MAGGFVDRIMVVIDSSSSGAVAEMDRLQRATKGAERSTIGLGKSLKAGLVAGAAAFAGAGLLSFLNDSVEAYGDAAKAAGELAKASGSSADTVSRLQAVLADSGISAEKSAGLLTKFTTQAGKQKGLLRELGVQLRTNADGSVDYANAMVQALDAINRTGDASKRNQQLVKLFGKAGAQAFQELAASGVSLSDAMATVSKYRIFDAADITRAQRYDDAMDSLAASTQGLQFALGQALVPALAAAADGLAAATEFLSGIPVQVYAAVGGFVALRGAMAFFGPALSSAISSAALALTGLGAVNVGSLASRLVSAIGPANLAMAGLAGAIAAYSIASSNAEDRAKEFAVGLDEMAKTGAIASKSLDGAAKAMIETSSWGERFVNLVKYAPDTQSWWEKWNPSNLVRRAMESFTKDTEFNMEAARAAIKAAADEMGAYGTTVAEAEVEQAALNELLASGTASAEEIGAAAQAAAVQQAEANAVTEAAAAAMGAYATTLQGVVDWQSRLASGVADAQSALGQLQDTLGKVGAIVDDPSTWENEVVLNTAQAEADLYRYIGILADSGLTSEQIIPLLVDLQNRDGTSTEADAIIQGVIDAISGKSNEVPPLLVGTALDPNAQANTQAGIAGLTAPKTTVVTVTTNYGDGGYAGAKARADYLSQTRQAAINVAHSFTPDGYNALKARTDYLAQARNGSVAIAVQFSPDGYNALKARADYLAQNRTATINVQVRGLEAARAALQGVTTNSAGRSAAQAASVNVNPQFSPINLVRVTLDGRELRAVVDDEIRAMTPYREEVA
jgi:hypothetical protein